ncbi:hypothetical protein Trydic_g3970 [Trypoxylus dichotomus]
MELDFVKQEYGYTNTGNTSRIFFRNPSLTVDRTQTFVDEFETNSSTWSHIGAFPIGLLSEEAQESRRKDYIYYRLHVTWKCSRTATMEDVFHKKLESSDPYIFTPEA